MRAICEKVRFWHSGDLTNHCLKWFGDTVINLRVKDKYELHAIHKALMEAKFHPDPIQIAVQGSPMVSVFMNHVVDELDKINWASEK